MDTAELVTAEFFLFGERCVSLYYVLLRFDASLTVFDKLAVAECSQWKPFAWLCLSEDFEGRIGFIAVAHDMISENKMIVINSRSWERLNEHYQSTANLLQARDCRDRSIEPPIKPSKVSF